jgi:phenylalanyl-tRNA synthetase beta chain
MKGGNVQDIIKNIKMANIKFPRKEFEKQVEKITEKTKEKIAMFGTPFESLTDEEIEIEIFPNRPDLLSMQGYIRSFLCFLEKKGTPKYKVKKPEKNYKVKIDKSVKQVRPYTACAIVKNLKFDEEKIKEIVDIQEKLHKTLGRNRRKLAIGIYPLEKISLPITYKAEKPEKIRFIPLETSKEINARQILQKHPAGREYGELLKGMKQYPVFRDAKGNVLSMPPIINSQMTGKINENTKEIFIECSGNDFEILKKTLNLIVTILADIGGKVYSMELNYQGKKIITPDLQKEKIKIDIKQAEQLLGIKLSDSVVKKLLEKMGYTYDKKKKQVEIPPYRLDILHPVDIYEDIAIAYGYDKFKPVIPEISDIGQETEKEVKKRKISEILAGLRILETSTHHLINKKDTRKSGLRLKKIQVQDSKTDYTILRPCMLISALKVLSENVDAKYPQKIFEIGKVFNLDSENEIQEKDELVAAISGQVDFTEIKQVLDYLMRMMNISYNLQEDEHPSFINGRCGKILINNKVIGHIGEISPYVLKNWHLKMPTAAFILDFDKLI